MLHTRSPGSGGERESPDPTTSYDNALQHHKFEFTFVCCAGVSRF
jgi:hypothetical protein